MNEETERDVPQRASPRVRWVLRPVWSVDPGLGRDDIPLRTHPLVIGRRPPAIEGAHAIADPRMSRVHATVVPSATEPRVRDSSANGTFVDGERVEDSAPLPSGAILQMGQTFFVVRALPLDAVDGDVPELLGRAPSIARLREGIALVAPSQASVLVLGESGTGKELVAGAIHRRSGRTGALVAVNCAAIPESLAESHLFGHVAGAFTGAKSPHDGVFRRAHGGTLFLDEIGEMPLPLQARFLRVLEERSVIAVGAERSVPIDVRVVAATNVDLLGAVERGLFRGDLYARISDFIVRAPPLRERREDVLPLLSRVLPGSPPMTGDLVEALLLHAWPFNVRELLKVGAELELRSRGREALDASLIAERLERPLRVSPPLDARGSAPSTEPTDEPITRERLESLLAETEGNVSEMARRLGRSRRQVRRYLETHGLSSGSD